MTTCSHVQPGAAGYAPCTWTYCTLQPGHSGDHSGPWSGHGPIQTWGPTDAFGRPIRPVTEGGGDQR